jgi:hypothetical protein
VREDGRIVGGEEWQEKVFDREEWKKLLRTARKSFCTCQWNRIEGFIHLVIDCNMCQHHLCHPQGADMCLLSYLYLLSLADKILHGGWRWVLKSDVVMCSLVRNTT